jgi:hypothetical protein
MAVLISLMGASQVAYAQTGGPYTYKKIQYPGAIYTDATGITNSGLVVGTYQDAQGNRHGYTYDGVNYTSVEFPGSVSNYLIGIGNNGALLGTYAMDVDGPYHGFVAEQGVFTSFDYPGSDTDARGMNSLGQIAGVYNAGGLSTPHGYVKTGEDFQNIDVPGAWGTEPWGINDAGVISGNYYDTAGGGIHGFMYANGSYQAVNFPGASLTRLTRVNNLNQAVGWHNQGDKTFGFVLSGSSYRSVSYDDSDSTVAADINDVGQVVGRFTGSDCPEGCGFVATPRSGQPLCSQHITMAYEGNVLTLGFNLGSTVPTTWSTFLFVQNTLVPLWSAPIPAIAPAVSFNAPLAGVPHLGFVFGVTLMSTASGGVVCADFEVINTGL